MLPSLAQRSPAPAEAAAFAPVSQVNPNTDPMIETGDTLELMADEAALASGMPADAVGKKIMLAQLEASLFGSAEAEPFRVGRFTVLEKLGAGGMGVVHAAYDPELERKIAVKFLRTEHPGQDPQGRARLLREAQALARLDHPNVVSIYDVGTYEGGVYIAMEFVRGSPLSQWTRNEDRSAEEIIELYLQAGRGLAAAHAAGVVHRDFKPDNAIVGEDGRVRVLDFGLAVSDQPAQEPAPPSSVGPGERGARGSAPTTRPSSKAARPATGASTIASASALTTSSADDDGGDEGVAADFTGKFMQPLTQTGALLGTPLFMAAEQHLGQRADARSDQFAFCVSLWLALFGERPFAGDTLVALREAVTRGELREPSARGRGSRVSKRVREALVRGLQPLAQDRFADVDALLAELDQSARRRRAGIWLAAALVLGAGAVGGIAAWQLRARSEPSICASAIAEIDQLWNPATEMDATARFGSTEAEATWRGVRTGLNSRVEKFRSALVEVCEGEELDLDRMSCLEWRRQELETVTSVILSSEPQTLHLVAEAVSGLTPIEACTDPRALRVLPPPHPDPETRKAIQRVRIDLARAGVLDDSGRHDEALRLATELARTAAKLDDPAVRAECALLLGQIYADAGRLKDAEAELEQAIDAAEVGAHDVVRARALAELVGLTGFALGRPTDRLESRFRALHARLGDLPTRAHVDFLNSLTMTRLGHGRLEAAQAAGQEALVEAERLGVDPTQSQAQLGLALTLLGRYDEASEQLERARAQIDDAHPAAVMVLGILGIQRGFAGYDREAVTSFERALTLESTRQLRQPHYRAIVGTYMANSLDRLGQLDKAIAVQQASIAALKKLWGEQHSSLGRAYHQFATTLADNGRWPEAKLNFERCIVIWSRTHGPDHRALAQPETGLARAHLHAGEHQLALSLLESAHAKLQQGQGHPAEDARTYFHLARALVLNDGDSERAQALAQRALSLLEALGPGYERDRLQVRAWHRAHAPDRAHNKDPG